MREGAADAPGHELSKVLYRVTFILSIHYGTDV
jgi:hypothetical protein